jgi:hypothetical protein
MKIKAFAILLIAFFSVQSASAADQVVILTWERGVEQTITMGGSTNTALWNLELRAKNGDAYPFSRSKKNSAGYFLYTLQIPNDFPKGRYEVYASTLNQPAQLSSYVDVVERNSFQSLIDVKEFGYLSTVAFALFTLIATARKEDFQAKIVRKSQEREDSGEEKTDPLSVDYKDNVVDLERRGIIDQIGYGRIDWLARLDALRYSLSQSLPRVSPLAGRYISDASWFQAVFGPLVIFLPIAGVATGVALSLDTDMTRSLVPSNLTLVLVGMILGTLDALAGLLVAATYMVWALASRNLVNAIDLRTLLVVSIIFAAPLLLVGKIRPLRREPDVWTLSERATDIVVVGVLSVVVVRALFVSLDVLSRQQTILASYETYFSLIAGGAIVIRYIIEDIAERIAPARLNYLVPTSIPAQEGSYFFGAVLIKIGAFFLFLLGFFGVSWQLIVGVSFLVSIEIMKYFKDSFPNSPFLYQLLPSGIPQIVVMAGVAVLVTSWAESLPYIAEDRARTIFVIVSIPSFIISLLKFFGRDPLPGDVKWYCRPKLKAVYFLFGPVMVATALALQLGVF